MNLTYGNQTIDFKCPDKVLLSLSGGLDSAAILYLICHYFPDTEIVPYTGHDVTAPMDYECTKDILQFIREIFPNANIKEQDAYRFDIWDPEWRAKAQEQWDSETTIGLNGTVVHKFKRLSGLVKVLFLNANADRLKNQYPGHTIMTGMTANPPVEEQRKYGFYDVAERRRDRRDHQIQWKMGRQYQPLVNVDKKFVAGVYKDHNLMDSLYPFTSSCVGKFDDTDYYSTPCGNCFWCGEKTWAFDT